MKRITEGWEKKILIIGLLNVALLTILERKLLGRFQRRKGPYRLITQAIKDAIKVIIKTRIIKLDYLFYIGPFLNIILTLIIWLILPIKLGYKEINITMDIIVYIILSSFNIYPFLYSGISSNSIYSQIGAIRAIVQMISYEINITVVIILLILILHTYNFDNFIYNQIDSFNFFLLSLPFFFLISLLAESNRTPFDILEGESELVGGYLTEYSSIEFTVIYLAEYLVIIINSYIFIILFIGEYIDTYKLLIIIILFIFIRSFLPRFKYTTILSFNWFSLLPLNMSLFYTYYILIY